MQRHVHSTANWATVVFVLGTLLAIAPTAEGQFRLFGPPPDDDDWEYEDREDEPPPGLFAQLRARRQMRRDLEAAEEYYDDLEDYYEDRDPRLAEYYERIEEYYEDLRDGRRVRPPVPPVQPRGADPRFAPGTYGAPGAPGPGAGAPGTGAPGAERWQPWGPAQRPMPDRAAPGGEGPMLAPPEQAGNAPPPPPSAPGDARRRGPQADPRVRLEQAYISLQDELRSLRVEGDADGADWVEYLALPLPERGASAEDPSVWAARGEQLTASLERYDQIASDPQYRMIARLPSFAPTRSALREVIAGWAQAPAPTAPAPDAPGPPPAEELPAPTPAEPK